MQEIKFTKDFDIFGSKTTTGSITFRSHTNEKQPRLKGFATVNFRKIENGEIKENIFFNKLILIAGDKGEFLAEPSENYEVEIDGKKEWRSKKHYQLPLSIKKFIVEKINE